MKIKLSRPTKVFAVFVSALGLYLVLIVSVFAVTLFAFFTEIGSSNDPSYLARLIVYISRGIGIILPGIVSAWVGYTLKNRGLLYGLLFGISFLLLAFVLDLFDGNSNNLQFLVGNSNGMLQFLALTTIGGYIGEKLSKK